MIRSSKGIPETCADFQRYRYLYKYYQAKCRELEREVARLRADHNM